MPDRHRCADCRFLWERRQRAQRHDNGGEFSRMITTDPPRCRNLACRDGGEVVDANVERECKHFRVKGE